MHTLLGYRKAFLADSSQVLVVLERGAWNEGVGNEGTTSRRHWFFSAMDLLCLSRGNCMQPGIDYFRLFINDLEICALDKN
jgi:hypothetical protein